MYYDEDSNDTPFMRLATLFDLFQPYGLSAPEHILRNQGSLFARLGREHSSFPWATSIPVRTIPIRTHIYDDDDDQWNLRVPSDTAVQNSAPMERSDSPTPKIKGLENPIGANNCFLNVVIQSLYHMAKFRTRFITTETQHCQDPCVFCALKQLFCNYEYGEDSSIPPTLMRKALAALYAAEKRFQLGELDDAAEAHSAILEAIHNSIVGGSKGSDIICSPPCVVHSCFAMNILETLECSCNEVSNILAYQEFIHYIPVDMLTELKGRVPNLSMDRIISYIHHTDIRKCPNKQCNQSGSIQKALLNSPEYISIGLVWSKSSVTRDELRHILAAIDLNINAAYMFDNTPNIYYSLNGFICYYGLHYVAYFNVKQRWIVFDDTSITLVGTEWSDVLSRLLLGKQLPFVLWYEKNS